MKHSHICTSGRIKVKKLVSIFPLDGDVGEFYMICLERDITFLRKDVSPLPSPSSVRVLGFSPELQTSW